MTATKKTTLDQSDILLFINEFVEIKQKVDTSLWPPFIEKLQKSLIYFSVKYPYKFENIGKEKVPGDFEKKAINKLFEEVIEMVPFDVTKSLV